ncbi:hypothetical protein P154DRAFT_480599 [Amniculicola lignicola CBS 123094]|uniref:Rhodopsin domain-containing protein n=1 Tax=Amniculicola lignicola CBS 123094 TaxID=1392246 RepID=A0A6A5X0H1_9PLEO|nr:hypothetical protein P154DRAFT_480599 [Amniculicola lignicola CBS 123094]
MAPPPPSSGPPPNLPLDDRSKEILIAIPILAAVSSIFIVFRLAVSFRNRRFYLLTDYLLVLGAALEIVAVVYVYQTALHGQGKHVWDPSMTPANLSAYFKELWFAQLFNIYAMAAVKGSIAAYLLMLDFSKTFRIMVWISLFIHITTNFIYPSVILFGECAPIAKHWNPMLPGYCWRDTPRVVSGYLGAGSNIATDLFYTSAPLVYLHNVQLPSRTKWGVRVVFLLGLITTTISALKFYEMRALHDSLDPSYKAVNLSIYSNAEVAAGIITASLPPLRKTIENLLKKVLPEGFMGMATSRTKGNSYNMPVYGSQNSRTEKPKHEQDDGSEKAILPEEFGWDNKTGIVRTTHFSVAGPESSSSSPTVLSPRSFEDEKKSPYRSDFV